MKRKWWTVCFLSILAGSALHFLYDLWPNPLTAVFAPVNESVWEHLKLLYWPFLAAAFVLTKDEADGRKSWCSILIVFSSSCKVASFGEETINWMPGLRAEEL